jgi:hypothetical protein
MAHDIAADVYSKLSGQPADELRCGPRFAAVKGGH